MFFFLKGDDVEIQDRTTPKIVKISDIPAGRVCKTHNNPKGNFIAIKVDPSTLNDGIVKNLGNGRLVMTPSDGKLWVLTEEITVYEVSSELIIKGVVS